MPCACSCATDKLLLQPFPVNDSRVWVILPARGHIDLGNRAAGTDDRKRAWAGLSDPLKSNTVSLARFQIAPLEGDAEQVAVAVLLRTILNAPHSSGTPGETYRDRVGEEVICDPAKFVVVVHGRRLAFLVCQEEVVKNTEGEGCFRSFGCRGIEAHLKQLHVVSFSSWTGAKHDWQLVNPRDIYYDHHSGGCKLVLGERPSTSARNGAVYFWPNTRHVCSILGRSVVWAVRILRVIGGIIFLYLLSVGISSVLQWWGLAWFPARGG